MKDRIFRPRVPVPEADPVRPRPRPWGAPAPDYNKLRWKYGESPWLRTRENFEDLAVVERALGYVTTRHLLWTAQAAREATSDEQVEALWNRGPVPRLFQIQMPSVRDTFVRLLGESVVRQWLGLPGSRTVARLTNNAAIDPAAGKAPSPRAQGSAAESSVTASAGHETTRVGDVATGDDMSHGSAHRPGATTLTAQLAVPTSASVPGKHTLTESLASQGVAGTSPAPAVQIQTGSTAEGPAAPGEVAPAASRPTIGELFGSRKPVVPVDRAQPATPVVQMRVGDEAHDPAAVQAAAARGVATPASPLPHKDDVQRSFGAHDVSPIQAHTGAEATASATAMGATAYAMGDHVVLSPNADLHTAAHEAAHVVQQRGGVQLKGGVGQAGDVYEQHADAVADAVVAGRSAETLLDQHASAARGGAHPAVQRREQNGPYAGNRPDPSSSTAAGYAIRSSASRIMHVGETVEYRVAPPPNVTGHLQVRWQVINDPTAASAPGIPATIDGPTDQLRWRLIAHAPGMHVIKAWVSVDGQQVAEVTYQQQVVSDARFVPLSGTGVAPLATMTDFIALVRRVESAYAGLPWQDIVSRMRKERYPGPGGPYAGIKAAFTWDDLVDEQETLPGLEVPPVAMEDIAALRLKPSVTTNSGVRVDVGHILTGVDSFNFPGVSGIFATHGTEGPAAATWSGDVGSALVEWANAAPLNDASVETKLRYYERYAGRTDMLGDVDALAIAHGPNLVLPSSAPLSQRLEVFYQTASAKGAHQRFHNFCRASHLNLTGNQLDATARARIRDQILRFARGYNVAGSATSGIMIAGGDVEDSSMVRVERNVDWFSDHFISWVNAGLLAEGAP